MYEWLIIAIPLFLAIFITLWVIWVEKQSHKGKCPVCGADMVKFIMSQKGEGGVAILWLCGNVPPKIVGISAAMPRQDWFISCKGINSKLIGMNFQNVTRQELLELTKQELPFNKRNPKCPDCNNSLLKFTTIPIKDGSMATLWLCEKSKVTLGRIRAGGAVQDWLITCEEIGERG